MRTDTGPGTGARHAGDAAVADPFESSPLRELRDAVDARLRTIVDGLRSDAPDGIVEAIGYSLLAPGKRVRPVLLLAAAGCMGVAPQDAIDVACAFELVHAYSLVHDDLPCMDDDDLRRGIPTSHRVYGEAVAVLVGDALQAEAFRLVAGASCGTAGQRLAVSVLLARAAGAAGMVGGQYLDIGEAGVDEASLRDIHGRKTGALLAGAIEAGAVLGGAGEQVRERFARFGAGLGWLFQLVDDLLDEVGDASVTGKQSGGDRRLGKVTAVTLFGIDGAREAADRQLALCLEVAATLPAQGGALADIARFVRDRDR